MPTVPVKEKEVIEPKVVIEDTQVADAKVEAAKILADAKAEAAKITKAATSAVVEEDAETDLGPKVEITLTNRLSTNGVVYGPGKLKVEKLIAEDLVARDAVATDAELERHRERNFVNDHQATRAGTAQSGTVI